MAEDNSNGIKQYLTNNIMRVIDITALVVALGITMQYNIASQKEVLQGALQQQGKIAEQVILLTNQVARLQESQERNRQDIERIKNRLEK